MANRKRKIKYRADRMKAAIAKTGLSQEQVLLKMTEHPIQLSTFNQNQVDNTIMPEVLREICKLINANPDYIAGITDYPIHFSFEQNETKEIDRFRRTEIPVKVTANLIAEVNVYDLNYTILREHGLNEEVLKTIKENPKSDLEYWTHKFLDYATSYAIDQLESNIKYFDEKGKISGQYNNTDIQFDVERLRSELHSMIDEIRKLFGEAEERKNNEEK